jgi:hypothetical protein
MQGVTALNFSRNVMLEINRLLKEGNLSENGKRRCAIVTSLHKNSVKFVLPKGGVVVESDLKSLANCEVLHLPYETICLEFETSDDLTKLKENQVYCPKRVIYAVEVTNYIVILPVAWDGNAKRWGFYPELFIPKTNWFEEDPVTKRKMINLRFSNSNIPTTDYYDEVTAVLSFLDILTCSNVSIQKNPMQKIKTTKIKSALPFDSYNILTIDVHRSKNNKTSQSLTGQTKHSPREHLRRGHIRHLDSGKSVWVNSCLVSHGIGGKIIKNYKVTT